MVALKQSEIHARAYTVEELNTPYNYSKQIEPGFLAITVSAKMVKQAIEVYRIFLSRMLRAGFTIDLNRPGSHSCPASAILVDGEEFRTRVKEKFAFKKVTSNSFTRRVSTPTGDLVLELYEGGWYKPSKVLNAKDKAGWESKAENLIPYLKEKVAQSKIRRIESLPWQLEREELERKRKEKARQLQERAETAKRVIADIRRYERAEYMRRYCDLAEQRPISDEYKKVLAVARSVADWIDPTIDYKDAILSEKYEIADFL